MPIVVGIQVRRTRDKIYADAGHLDLAVSEKVIIELEDTQEVGLVITPEKMVEKVSGPIGKVLRKFAPDDIPRIRENREKESRAAKIVSDNIEAHDLDMKLTCLDYTFDRSKLFVYYTAENRVDFRTLIKDLGHILKTRIQMVQIGVRDETKIIGGLGSCGQVLCCKRFLKEFSTVSIDMAKEQDLSLNTLKISGICGRLMCCLAYEYDGYCQIKKKMPPLKSKVKTPDGAGIVIGLQCVSEEVTVDLGEGKILKYDYRAVTPIT